jgi:DNA-binding HxlR family transcriptional regulator
VDYTLHLSDSKEPRRGAADDAGARDGLVNGVHAHEEPSPASLAHDGSVPEAGARERCSIRRALEVAGNRSALLIMREAFYGTTRFDDFAGRAGISEPVTATRLRDLVDHGLLRREPYRDPGQRTRMAYHLTDMGAGLLPVLIALMNWGDRWLSDGAAPLSVRHRDCGEPVRAELRCGRGHRLAAADVYLSAGPGARSADAAPAAHRD